MTTTHQIHKTPTEILTHTLFDSLQDVLFLDTRKRLVDTSREECVRRIHGLLPLPPCSLPSLSCVFLTPFSLNTQVEKEPSCLFAIIIVSLFLRKTSVTHTSSHHHLIQQFSYATLNPSMNPQMEDRSVLFNEINSFSHRKLKKVETKVVTGLGENVIEKRGAKGLQAIPVSSSDAASSAADGVKLDLQVGLVVPGILIGESLCVIN